MKTKPGEDLKMVRKLVAETKNLEPSLKVGELIAAAEQITGVVDEITGEVEIPGLMREKGAIDVLEEIRGELARVLNSSPDWEEKSEQKQKLREIENRINRARGTAEMDPAQRIQRRAE